MSLVQLGFYEEFANIGTTSVNNMTAYMNDKFTGLPYRPAFAVGAGNAVTFTKTESTLPDGRVRSFMRGRNSGASSNQKIFYTGIRIETLSGQTGRYVAGCRLTRTNIITPTVYPCGFTQDGVRTMLSPTAETEIYIEADLDFTAKELKIYINGALSVTKSLTVSTSNAPFEVYLGSVQTTSSEGYALLQATGEEAEISDYYLIRDEPGQPTTPRLGAILIDKRVADNSSNGGLLSASVGNATNTGVFSNGTYTIGSDDSILVFNKLADTVGAGQVLLASAFQILAGRADSTSPTGINITAIGKDDSGDYPTTGQLQKDLGNVVRSPGQFILTPAMVGGPGLRGRMDYIVKATK